MRFIIRSGKTAKLGAYFHEGPHSGTYWDPAGPLAQPTPYESRAAAEEAMPRALATSLPDCETRPADARVVRLLSHAEAKAKAAQRAVEHALANQARSIFCPHCNKKVPDVEVRMLFGDEASPDDEPEAWTLACSNCGNTYEVECRTVFSTRAL